MKKVGITCDDYKVEKFKEELTKAGFTKFEVFPFTGETLKGNTLIKVEVEDHQVNDVKKLCQRVELHFKTFPIKKE